MFNCLPMRAIIFTVSTLRMLYWTTKSYSTSKKEGMILFRLTSLEVALVWDSPKEHIPKSPISRWKKNWLDWLFKVVLLFFLLYFYKIQFHYTNNSNSKLSTLSPCDFPITFEHYTGILQQKLSHLGWHLLRPVSFRKPIQSIPHTVMFLTVEKMNTHLLFSWKATIIKKWIITYLEHIFLSLNSLAPDSLPCSNPSIQSPAFAIG